MNKPMLLTSVNMEGVCTHCRSAYGIVGVHYDREANAGIAIRVGKRPLVMPAVERA